MINRVEAKIDQVSVHHVGLYTEEEGVLASSSPMKIDTAELHDHLSSFFIDIYSDPEFFEFSTKGEDANEHSLFSIISAVFDNKDIIHETSVKLARKLYDSSDHPAIKRGDLFVCYIQDVLFEDELIDAVAIVKSENKDSFLQVVSDNGSLMIDVSEGIHLKKVDKACLILNTNKENGYKVCIKDKNSHQKDAVFWKEHFLGLQPVKDNYHATAQYIEATRSFIKERLPYEDDVDKRDEAEILHRSKKYLSEADEFNKEEYTQKVFTDEERQASFNEFCDVYMENNNVTLEDNFSVSPEAVKKKTKYFRSVIKLDKNFHIYAHGDKTYMEKGQDEQGRKYYKLYYEAES